MRNLNNLARNVENVAWVGDSVVRPLQNAQRPFRLHLKSVDSRAHGRAKLKGWQGRTFVACARCNGPMKSVSRLLCVFVCGPRTGLRCGRKLQRAIGDESRLISVIEFRTRSRFWRCALQHQADRRGAWTSAILCKLRKQYLLKLVSILEAVDFDNRSAGRFMPI